MPLYEGIEEAIKKNLEDISSGNKPPVLPIGEITQLQHEQINEHREKEGLPPLESREVLYIGRHHFTSRVTGDGYLVQDLLVQIKSGLSEESVFKKNPKKPHGTVLINPNQRDDGYGNMVNDNAVLELTTRKPRAELFSIIPKGDKNKPLKK